MVTSTVYGSDHHCFRCLQSKLVNFLLRVFAVKLIDYTSLKHVKALHVSSAHATFADFAATGQLG